MTTLIQPIVRTAALCPVAPRVPAVRRLRQHATALPVSPPVRIQPTDTAATCEELLNRLHDLPAGDPDRVALRARIIEEELPLARRLARRYAGRGEPVDDLAQVAALALIRAVDAYDPARLIPFAGYATPSILGTLKRHFRDTTWRMRVARSTQELSRTVAIATGELSQRLGHWPTATEIAGHLHITLAVLQTAIASTYAYHPASLDAGGDGPRLGDHLGGDDPGYDLVEENVSHQALRDTLAALPVRERRILTLRFFDQLSQAQIAAEVGLSQMHVSRLLRQSLLRLRGEIAGPADRVAS